MGSQITEEQIHYIKCATDIVFFAQEYFPEFLKNVKHLDTAIALPALADYKHVIVVSDHADEVSALGLIHLVHQAVFSPGIYAAYYDSDLKNGFLSVVNNIRYGRLKVMFEKMNVRIKSFYSDYQLQNGSHFIGSTVTKGGTRGYCPDRLFINNAAHHKYGEDFYCSLMGSVSSGGRMIINSAPSDDPKCLYNKLLENSHTGRNDYNIINL